MARYEVGSASSARQTSGKVAALPGSDWAYLPGVWWHGNPCTPGATLGGSDPGVNESVVPDRLLGLRSEYDRSYLLRPYTNAASNVRTDRSSALDLPDDCYSRGSTKRSESSWISTYRPDCASSE